MLPGWVIVLTALAYLMLLFAVASYGDRRAAGRRASRPRPVIYSLSLAIYCTSWTYFGAVGLAADRGLEFLGIYIGPVILFTLGQPFLRRVVGIAKAERLTSIADFIAARYGKSPAVAAIVALIAVVGTIPYIALQLKSVSSSVATLVPSLPGLAGRDGTFLTDISLVVTLGLAAFAMIFGTRHTDATEHQDGLILAIAAESVVKLMAITAVGLFVVFGLFGGPEGLFMRATTDPQVIAPLSHETPFGRWVVLTVLSAFAILMLPRQFHVTVVENRSEGELRLAGILLPVYLVAINLFVIPLAIGGITTFGGQGNGDLYVLTVPLAHGMPVITLLAFLGGFSAATAMVIVASVAVAIMVSNDLVMPFFVRRRAAGGTRGHDDFGATILVVRRTSIVAILLLGYLYYSTANLSAGLASIGLLSFAAIAQFAPPLIGGLLWRRANARGAIAGLLGGIVIWGALLFTPSFGGPDNSRLATSILGFVFGEESFFTGPNADPLVNTAVLSLLVNTLLFVFGSLTRAPSALERLQAGVFIPERPLAKPLVGRWRTKVTVQELQQTISRYLGEERARRSLSSYEESTDRPLKESEPVDAGLVRFAEQLLASAIGSASARLVLSLLFQKNDDTPAETARLLDQASEALQYNRDLLQSALGQMDQGITVFDRQRRLVLWNRRFRLLFDQPEKIGQVGVPLEDVVSILVKRGDLDSGDEDQFIRDFLTMDAPFQLTVRTTGTIIEIRSNRMPDMGVVTTYADITARVAADVALKQANETLEARVGQRTAELTAVNRQLADARAAAEEANIGKTRFLAAVGHDILQPLNAARLYSSSLVERMGESENGDLVRNIDSSLESVETILSAVLDLSRLDTGAMKPELSVFPLNDVLTRVATDFAPIAHERRLSFAVMPTSVYVRSDPNLLRRLVQNLVSNAIKYTREGRVLIGVRRLPGRVQIQVVDTGIGIPASKFRTVFKEFARLDEGARTAAGLGLGLSIVDRIARVLGHAVHLDSRPGRGTDFRVEVPLVSEVGLLQAKAKAKAQAAPLASPISALAGMAVLCIDNETAILDGMTLLLEGWGCRVRTIASAAALEALAADEPPDVIVADFHLDDGTGIEAILRARGFWSSDLPGLLITADRSQEVRAEAEATDIAVQNKPIRPAGLRAYLNQIAAARRSAAE
ncbi:MAG: PAS domain-containing hybrid sensor histidine kinase/response regulator [Pararhizobium sp.]